MELKELYDLEGDEKFKRLLRLENKDKIEKDSI